MRWDPIYVLPFRISIKSWPWIPDFYQPDSGDSSRSNNDDDSRMMLMAMVVMMMMMTMVMAMVMTMMMAMTMVMTILLHILFLSSFFLISFISIWSVFFSIHFYYLYFLILFVDFLVFETGQIAMNGVGPSFSRPIPSHRPPQTFINLLTNSFTKMWCKKIINKQRNDQETAFR